MSPASHSFDHDRSPEREEESLFKFYFFLNLLTYIKENLSQDLILRGLLNSVTHVQIEENLLAM